MSRSALAVSSLAFMYLLSGTVAAQSTSTQPERVVLRMEIDVARPAEEAWNNVSDFCAIGEWLGVECRIASGNGDVGTVRIVAGRVTEVLIAKSDLSYRYSQQTSKNSYQASVEAQPVTSASSRFVYTVEYDALDGDDRNADIARRRNQFDNILRTMKGIAEAAPIDGAVSERRPVDTAAAILQGLTQGLANAQQQEADRQRSNAEAQRAQQERYEQVQREAQAIQAEQLRQQQAQAQANQRSAAQAGGAGTTARATYSSNRYYSCIQMGSLIAHANYGAGAREISNRCSEDLRVFVCDLLPGGTSRVCLPGGRIAAGTAGDGEYSSMEEYLDGNSASYTLGFKSPGYAVCLAGDYWNSSLQLCEANPNANRDPNRIPAGSR